MNNRLICGYLLVFIFRHAIAYKCFHCMKQDNNTACLEKSIECRHNQACESTYKIKKLGTMSSQSSQIQKRCVNVCTSPGIDVCYGRMSCRYCCYGDHCNQHLKYNSLNTTSPVQPQVPVSPPVYNLPPKEFCPNRYLQISFSASAYKIRQMESYWKIITFDEIKTDYGGLMIKYPGKHSQRLMSNRAVFLIKQPGVYMFFVTSVVVGKAGNIATPVVLKRNFSEILVNTDPQNGANNRHKTHRQAVSVGQALLELNSGDRLALYIAPIRSRYSKDIFHKYSSLSEVTFSAFLVHTV